MLTSPTDLDSYVSNTRWSPWGQPGSATGRVPMLSLTQILRGIHLAEFGLQSKFLFSLRILTLQVLAWWQNIKWAFLLCGMSVVAGISDPFGLYLNKKKKEEEERKKKEELTCSFWSTAAGSESRAVPGIIEFCGKCSTKETFDRSTLFLHSVRILGCIFWCF